MIGIILAAGTGTRLGTHTANTPKGLVPLAGRGLLERQLSVLATAGLRDVTIVTGHCAERIDALGHATRHNARYRSTNMVASLMCAADRLRAGDDVLVAYADIVYEPRVAQAVMRCSAPFATAVDRSWADLWSARGEDPLTTAETLRIGENGTIRELGKKARTLEEIEGQYMGLTRLSADFAAQVVEIHERLDPHGPYDGRDRDNMYMTSFLQHLIDTGHPLTPIWVDGGWLELDTTEDLEIYERLWTDGQLRALCDLSTA